jgi:cystathionine beta-lyase family protein involved in aluminum resistance
VSGDPYDTLEEVIGRRGAAGIGSLLDYGIRFRSHALSDGGQLDVDRLAHSIVPGAHSSIGRSLWLKPCVICR